MARASLHQASEHPLDVLHAILAMHADGQSVALAVLSGTTGGAVRAPGAMMAVSEDGCRCGYLSGGCIDADVTLRAQMAIADNAPAHLRYGSGSPFRDIQLPCGGAIDVAVIARPNIQILAAMTEALASRKIVHATLNENRLEHADPARATLTYHPKLRLRIAGRGADPLVLSRLAVSSGFDTEFWSPDAECIAEAETITQLKTSRLTMPGALPNAADDPHTAFVLMFHDHDWEPPLLENALAGDAFYVGAVGSPRTHARRCEVLRQRGLSDETIARIHGPIGLLPSMRDASMLAISTLAEIVDEFHKRCQP